MQNSNFLDFFGLRERPFNVNLDPRFLFVTPQLDAAFSGLMDGIRDGNCFAVITGEVGTGKTTLIHRLLRQLMQQGVPTAFLFYTHLNRTHLLDFILTDFGIPSNSGETIDCWKQLKNWLIERHYDGQRPVLLVDEAQGLLPSAFEEIRMLLNLEAPREKLLQVVLAGDLELEEKLKHIQMRPLQQRITARCKTATLNRHETFDYVRYRLEVGGAKNQPLFQPDAIDAIYFHSHGIPRVINVLCEQALINAFADQIHVVTARLIQEVARAFQWENANHLPATESPANLAAVDSTPAPRIAGQELPLIASQPVLDELPAVLPVLPFAKATLPGSEFPLKNRSGSAISEPPTIPVQQSLENNALGPSDQQFIALSARGGEKGELPKLAKSCSQQLLAEFIQELENQTEFRHSKVQANICGRKTGQCALPPLTMKINNRRAWLARWKASPFWAWWFYGVRPNWRKEIGAVANLPRWRRRFASLQRRLKETLRPFQRELGKSHSGDTSRSLNEKSR